MGKQKDLFKGNDGYSRCYESHPALILKDDLKIYGGSCITPVIKDADVYIGFDSGMKRSDRGFPWEPKPEVEALDVYMHISDGAAPKDLINFNKLLEWTAQQIESGKKVHVGCIGGHGRTGTFLAALVYVMTGRKDAGAYVREAYCKKVIETTEQVNFLFNKFGIEKVDPRPHYSPVKGGSYGGYESYDPATGSYRNYGKGFGNSNVIVDGGPWTKFSPSTKGSSYVSSSGASNTGKPNMAKGNVWGLK